MGASVNLKNSVGGFFYILPLEVHLYNKRLGIRQQGGVVCTKANMCSTPLRRATLSLAGSAHKKCIDSSMQESAVIRNLESAVIRYLGRRFYGR
jgi:hypothetical protein